MSFAGTVAWMAPEVIRNESCSEKVDIWLEEALELLNSLDSDESDVEIAVLPPDASELTDEDEGDENEVNTGEIIISDVAGYLEEFCLFTGYSNTCERDYWSDVEDLGITLVKNAMSRNRFQKLKSYLHFGDIATVSPHTQDRSFKVKPLYAILNDNFMKFGHCSANLRICDARNDNPLGTRVVMKLTENFVNPSSYTLYFAYFFTSIDLLKSLGEHGFRATRTTRENRVNHRGVL
ncbi:zinc finger protein [Trichonephila clavipes]|uniref:Zinc finger protein n=1 Tax=Trichonephila clavipes TaxID=2585209 RepID=A0A8X6V3Z1_TRICX|nr:zinc finger protein [Trichonephila clavipes]